MMQSKKKHMKKKKSTAARTIPALLLCFLLLSGALIFVNRNGETTRPSDEEKNAGGESGAGETEPETETPPPPTTEDLLKEYIADMTVEEKVGQLFLMRYPENGDPAVMENFKPGGVVLFARDFEQKTPDEVRAELAACQQNSRVPLLTSVDEEGGTVTRISRFPQYRSERFLSPRQLFTEGGWDRILSDTVEKCQLLASLGINVNLAPVCDMTADSSSYIYERTFSGDAEGTSEYIRRVVSIMKEQNTGSVLKHFPGYGGNADTHKGFSVDSRAYSEFTESDFLPFEAGIEAGAGCVMISHNIVECMDAESPASMSPEVHRVLREELGFEGVIMTDDLSMLAIADAYGTEAAAVLAVQAGNDMLCCTDYDVQIPAVIEAVKSGEISEERSEESVLRVLLWKHDLGLVETEEETV